MQATLLFAIAGFAMVTGQQTGQQSCVQQLQAYQQCAQNPMQQLQAQRDQVVAQCMGAQCQQQLAAISMCKQMKQSAMLQAVQSCASVTGFRFRRSNENSGDYDDFLGPNPVGPNPLPNPNSVVPPQQFHPRGRRGGGGYGGNFDGGVRRGGSGAASACRPINNSTQSACIASGLQTLQATSSSLKQQLTTCKNMYNSQINVACQQLSTNNNACNCICTQKQSLKSTYNNCLTAAGITPNQSGGQSGQVSQCNNGCSRRGGFNFGSGEIGGF